MRRRKAVYEQKQPYSEKEVSSILDAAGKINSGTTGYAKTPATFKVLIELRAGSIQWYSAARIACAKANGNNPKLHYVKRFC